MQKILVIDDDQDILDLLCFNLERAGIKCISALEGVEGFALATSEVPDLIVLDIMMPGFSGIEVLKRLKREVETRRIPVVMLTAKGEEVDRVLGLELGVEDYVTKPFSVRELVLRITRILARFDRNEEGPLLRCNGITLDSESYEVRVAGSSVRLTTTEFNLLAYLLKNKGRVLSRDRLLEHVWGYRYGGTTRTVDTHVQRLREKLGDEANCIETIRGVGYKLQSVRSG